MRVDTARVNEREEGPGHCYFMQLLGQLWMTNLLSHFA